MDKEVRRRLSHRGRENLQEPEGRVDVGDLAGAESALQREGHIAGAGLLVGG